VDSKPYVDSRPYGGLTPDAVLDALESIGLRGDGRMLGLNSYENRVYQISLEDDSHVVAKFYRPARWTDAQISKSMPSGWNWRDAKSRWSHRVLAGKPLHVQHLSLRVYGRRGGRPPELEDEKVLRNGSAAPRPHHARRCRGALRERPG
jgi:hypothetical protein